MTFGLPLRDLGRSPAALRAEAEEKRAQMIRAGRAWVSTHTDPAMYVTDQQALNVTRMLNVGRDGIDVLNYLRREGGLPQPEQGFEQGFPREAAKPTVRPPMQAWQRGSHGP